MISKAIDFKVKTLVDSLFVWNYKTAFKWRGLEFSDFKIYEDSDDARFIDFVASEKERKLLVKKYVEERELKVYFILDVSDSMNFWMGNTKKIETLIETFYIISYASILNNDMVWAIILWENTYDIISPSKWKKQILKIINKISQKNFNFKKQDNFDINKILNSLKVKNSLVFMLSDEVDSFQNKDLKMLSLKNDFIYINIFDSFENELSSDGFLYNLWNAWVNSFINTRNKKKVLEYKELRKAKLRAFKNKLASYKIDYISLDEKKNIFKEILKFFKTR